MITKENERYLEYNSLFNFELLEKVTLEAFRVEKDGDKIEEKNHVSKTFKIDDFKFKVDRQTRDFLYLYHTLISFNKWTFRAIMNKRYGGKVISRNQYEKVKRDYLEEEYVKIFQTDDFFLVNGRDDFESETFKHFEPFKDLVYQELSTNPYNEYLRLDEERVDNPLINDNILEQTKKVSESFKFKVKDERTFIIQRKVVNNVSSAVFRYPDDEDTLRADIVNIEVTLKGDLVKQIKEDIEEGEKDDYGYSVINNDAFVSNFILSQYLFLFMVKPDTTN